MAVIGALAASIVGGVVAVRLDGGGDGGPGARDVVAARADLTYTIPAGTGERLDRGEDIELVPDRITARVGQIIRIDNLDDRDYVIGPFPVQAGTTVTQVFTRPGTFVGECAVHPSGQLVVEVSG